MNGKGIILAVDDTPECLLMIADTLTAEGYELLPADSGELALAYVAARTPELILLDIRMPGMDGFEVCRRLQANERSRDIPVIFLSALTETGERVEGLSLGAVDYIAKPFQKEELLARIHNHLELSRLRQRLEEQVAERTANLKALSERLQVQLTDRIQAERAVRESEARFRNMADSAPVAIWTSGPDTKINFCNQYALTFTGRTLEELTGDRWKDILHPEDLEHTYPNYIPVIEAHRDYRAEYRVRRADGEYRWMLDTATPRLLPNGKFAGYIGVAIDVTDFKRDQEQLAAAQKLESLGSLVAGVAHNFNNVLGTILAEADLALSDTPPDSPARDSLERINAATLRASETVAMLMAYAGTDAGASTLLDVTPVIEETLRLFRAAAPRRADIRVSLARSLPAVRAEVPQIRQAVMNLLTNAWESLRNGTGWIQVTTACVSDRPAMEPDRPAGRYVRLEVTDTGCGIPEETKSRIFDPFYTTKSLGRGLGLPAVQGIVRSLGGTIQVRSSPGQGSTFEILLPCA